MPGPSPRLFGSLPPPDDCPRRLTFVPARLATRWPLHSTPADEPGPPKPFPTDLVEPFRADEPGPPKPLPTCQAIPIHMTDQTRARQSFRPAYSSPAKLTSRVNSRQSTIVDLSGHTQLDDQSLQLRPFDEPSRIMPFPTSPCRFDEPCGVASCLHTADVTRRRLPNRMTIRARPTMSTHLAPPCHTRPSDEPSMTGPLDLPQTCPAMTHDDPSLRPAVPFDSPSRSRSTDETNHPRPGRATSQLRPSRTDVSTPAIPTQMTRRIQPRLMTTHTHTPHRVRRRVTTGPPTRLSGAAPTTAGHPTDLTHPCLLRPIDVSSQTCPHDEPHRTPTCRADGPYPGAPCRATHQLRSASRRPVSSLPSAPSLATLAVSPCRTTHQLRSTPQLDWSISCRAGPTYRRNPCRAHHIRRANQARDWPFDYLRLPLPLMTTCRVGSTPAD